jgi:hypothetical protein
MHSEVVVLQVAAAQLVVLVNGLVPHLGSLRESSEPRATQPYPVIAPTALPFKKVTVVPVGGPPVLPTDPPTGGVPPVAVVVGGVVVLPPVGGELVVVA